ncbi:SDR family NAD(P)-dependent oxidoreductase, partial [Trueperella sp.]|uniref:SDR family NAD(P)-dependent oxidoreductase n=1 Tax=Trueperella sp. TaxID=2699835 RepID=UPI003736757C
MALDGKVALITGAGSGFGKATSLLFAKNGAKVVAVDLNLEAAKAVVEEIEGAGGSALALKADVSSEDEVKSVIDRAVEEFGQLDILFNNAGTYVHGNVEETSTDGWHKSVEVNLSSVFYGVKHAIPHLKKTKGNIISTASAGGV